MNTNKSKQQRLTENERTAKHWIHKLDGKYIKSVHKKKILGAGSKRARTIKNIEIKDKILLCTSLSIKQRPILSFIGYGVVEDIFDENKQYLGFDKSQRKIKLRGIKYFKEPVAIKDVADNLEFIKNKKKSSGYLRSEYREISEEEFKAVIGKRKTASNFPDYLERITYTTGEFLTNSIKGLFNVIKVMENSNQIEIKLFLKTLHRLISPFGISKSYEDIERFYSENAWKLKFEHTPSRDPDKFVTLYDSKGNPHRFGYIRLR